MPSRTLCLEQAVLRTTSAPESSRQCFRLAGGWEEHRGTVSKEILVSWMNIKIHVSDLKRSKKDKS